LASTVSQATSGIGITPQERVQNNIRDLIGDFVGMTFGDRFRGKEVALAVGSRSFEVSCLATLPIWRARNLDQILPIRFP
jgi:hypothetical protein